MRYLKYGVMTGTLIAVMMGLSGSAVAGTDEEQLARMKDPDQWPAPGRDFSLTRHSHLKDINTDNVGKLQMAWSQLGRPARPRGPARRHRGRRRQAVMFFSRAARTWSMQHRAGSRPDGPRQSQADLELRQEDRSR